MIRLAREDETKLIANMWDICFDDPPHFIKWNFSRNYSPKNTLVFEENGVLCANMQLMPYTLSLCGRAVPVSYISGVATLPEYRMRGCYKSLQAEAFSLMARRGIPIAILVPFNFEFYEKQGFSAYCDKTVYTLCGRHFKRGGAHTAPLSDETAARLDEIYRRCTAALNGFVIRSGQDLRLILEDVILNSGGGCVLADGGYALYRLDKSTNTAEVFEMMCENPCIAESLLGEIGAENFKITAPRSAFDRGFAEAESKRFAMMRIVDVRAVLEILARDFEGDIRIKVTDENIERNNAVFQISRGSVVRVTGHADISVDVKRLAELASGYEEDKSFGGLFKKRENFVNLLL